MISPLARATLTFLVYQWPKAHVTMTRRLLLSFVYLIDHNSGASLELPWDLDKDYISCALLLRDMDRLGCIRVFQKSIKEENFKLAIQILEEAGYRPAAEEVLAQMNNCASLMDAERLAAEALSLWRKECRTK